MSMVIALLDLVKTFDELFQLRRSDDDVLEGAATVTQSTLSILQMKFELTD